MPLSEHEQRLLDQIERALYAEDPKFASTVRGGRLRRPSRRRRLLGVALFLIGVVALVLGVVLVSSVMTAGVVVSVVGFLAMFGGVVLAITASGAGKKAQAAAEGEAAAPASEKERSKFTSRMEERFRKRFDQE